MKSFETLYARNSNGSINIWGIGVQDNGISVIWEGLKDGEYTRTERQAKSKNIGKMNETTPYQQALKDAESRWTLKKKKGYKSLADLGITSNPELLEITLPQNRTDANNLSKPMKAQQYYKVKTVEGKKIKTNEPVIKFPCFGQYKLNGYRVTARWEEIEEGEGIFRQKVGKVTFRSKEGLRYTILEHIEQEFTKEMFFFRGITSKGEDDTKQLQFDGEMYCHGKFLSEITSACKTRQPLTLELKFNIFDLAVEEFSQKTRLVVLNMLKNTIFKDCKNIVVLDYKTIENDEQAQILTDEAIALGYEGGIFRDMKATYQFGKRPQTMTKLKRSEDSEFEIIDVISGENTPTLGVFVCRAENGLSFNCTPEGTQELKENYLLKRTQYIGKKLTVRFFERTIDGKPNHAVGVAVRDYE